MAMIYSWVTIEGMYFTVKSRGDNEGGICTPSSFARAVKGVLMRPATVTTFLIVFYIPKDSVEIIMLVRYS